MSELLKRNSSWQMLFNSFLQMGRTQERGRDQLEIHGRVVEDDRIDKGQERDHRTLQVCHHLQKNDPGCSKSKSKNIQLLLSGKCGKIFGPILKKLTSRTRNHEKSFLTNLIISYPKLMILAHPQLFS